MMGCELERADVALLVPSITLKSEQTEMGTHTRSRVKEEDIIHVRTHKAILAASAATK